jgi:hypothetical protein
MRRAQAPAARPTVPAEPPSSGRPSIINPVIDVLLVGGLSLIVFVPLLLSGRTDLVMIGAGAQAWLAATINMPHFMASYRIVYRSREMILKHKWASIFVPAILVAYSALALYVAQDSPALIIVLVAVASGYLAWHYTGQVWGMMASYAYLGGLRFERSERVLIRTGLRILLVWHVTWFLYTQLRDPSRVQALYELITMGTAVAFLVGAAGIVKIRLRTGKFPPAQALVAWAAIFVWYAVMARDPKALFWIQIAHALQYLAFPVRVEINRTSHASHASEESHNHEPDGGHGMLVRHMGLYGAGLLAVSLLITRYVPASAMSVVGNVFGENPSRAAPILLLMIINIHHYFTDGVIWKISNPEVRQELFAHVMPAKKGADKPAASRGVAAKGGVAPKARVAAKK